VSPVELERLALHEFLFTEPCRSLIEAARIGRRLQPRELPGRKVPHSSPDRIIVAIGLVKGNALAKRQGSVLLDPGQVEGTVMARKA
jgi:hypothetical protein